MDEKEKKALDGDLDGRVSSRETADILINSIKTAGHRAIFHRKIANESILSDMRVFEIPEILKRQSSFALLHSPEFPRGIDRLSSEDAMRIHDAAVEVRRIVGRPEEASWGDVMTSGYFLAVKKMQNLVGNCLPSSR